MSRDEFTSRLLWLLPAFAVVAVLLRLAVGAQAFAVFGIATTALLLLPLATRIVALRLRAVGQSPRKALLLAVPLGLLAAGHILFWLAFFSSRPDTVVMLGSVRSMALTQVPFALPAVQTIAAAIAAWPILTGLRRASALD